MDAKQMADAVAELLGQDRRFTVDDKLSWKVHRMNDEHQDATSVEFGVEDQDGARHGFLIET